ncbi:MAG: hypothetical protein AAFQ68_28615 [Bacteroidota bacterium]
MNHLISVLFLAIFLSISAQIADEDNKYLQQTPPSTTPEKFAPGLISLPDEYEFGSVFNRKGTEFFYGVDLNGKSEIRYSKLESDQWTKPEVILVNDDYGYNDPFLSPDEQRLYFISEREGEGFGGYDIWYVERTPSGWSESINAGPKINSASNEYYISFTKDGTMYFSSNKNAPQDRNGDFDIYYSDYEEGEFLEAVQLGDAINSNRYEADVFIDPNEDYIIFCGNRPEGMGRGDLYISFKQEDGSWGKAKNMGEPINTTGHELCPYVTGDGKYFLYTSNQDLYWVSTAIFDQYRE